MENGKAKPYCPSKTNSFRMRVLFNCIFHPFKNRMANLLLQKLLEPNTSKRYTADNVLKHPWITRNPMDEIPKTYLETMRIRTLKNKMINVLLHI
jgi:hypothetical protein